MSTAWRKYLSASYSPLFLSWARYAVASLLVLPLAAWHYGPRVLPAERHVAHVLRTVFLVSAMTLYFLSVARIPLATATTAYMVGPIVAVALSVPLLKERLTFAKAVSLALGVAGSLAILRPGCRRRFGSIAGIRGRPVLRVLSDRHAAGS